MWTSDSVFGMGNGPVAFGLQSGAASTSAASSAPSTPGATASSAKLRPDAFSPLLSAADTPVDEGRFGFRSPRPPASETTFAGHSPKPSARRVLPFAPTITHTVELPNPEIASTIKKPVKEMCRFFANGTGCVRGADCPYSHDLTIAAPCAESAAAGFVLLKGVANASNRQSIRSPVPAAVVSNGLNPEARSFDYAVASGSGTPTIATPFMPQDCNEHQQHFDGGYYRPELDNAGPYSNDFPHHHHETVTDENHTSGYHHGYLHHPHQGAGASFSHAVEEPQSYFGASSHLIGQPHAVPPSSGLMSDAESVSRPGAYGEDQTRAHPFRYTDGPHYATNHGRTPPSYTMRRRPAHVAEAYDAGFDPDAMQPVPLDFATRQAQAMRPPLQIGKGGPNASAAPSPMYEAEVSMRPRPPLQSMSNSAPGYSQGPYQQQAGGYHEYGSPGGHMMMPQQQHYQQHHQSAYHEADHQERFVPWRGVY